MFTDGIKTFALSVVNPHFPAYFLIRGCDMLDIDIYRELNNGVGFCLNSDKYIWATPFLEVSKLDTEMSIEIGFLCFKFIVWYESSEDMR